MKNSSSHSSLHITCFLACLCEASTVSCPKTPCCRDFVSIGTEAFPKRMYIAILSHVNFSMPIFLPFLFMLPKNQIKFSSTIGRTPQVALRFKRPPHRHQELNPKTSSQTTRATTKPKFHIPGEYAKPSNHTIRHCEPFHESFAS